MVCVWADSASVTEAPKGLGLVLEQGLVERDLCFGGSPVSSWRWEGWTSG